MACLLKIPTKNSRGVISFTNVERDMLILKDESLKSLIEELRKDWAIALHHNWYNFDFKYDPLFDFVIAAKTAIQTSDGIDFPQLDITASNFVPDFFEKQQKNELFWDILHVSRAQKHKNILFFFEVIRELFDQGKMLRVLLICTIPDNAKNNPEFIHDVRDYYDELFSEEEKDHFTLLTTDYRNPFPFDLEMIAHFYKSSKILLNTGVREHGGRINTYAWRSSMPVVAFENIGHMLTEQYRREPFFFEAHNKKSFTNQILRAVALVDAGNYIEDLSEISQYYDSANSEERIINEIDVFCQRTDDLDYQRTHFNFNDLSMRFARHHEVGGSFKNGVKNRLKDFLSYLEESDDTELNKLIGLNDPEAYVSTKFSFDPSKWASVGGQSLIGKLKSNKVVQKVRKKLKI